MDKLTHYRKILQQIVEEECRHQPIEKTVRLSPVIDTLHDHYGVLLIGWENSRHIQGFVLLMDIINEKIWIQYDGTYPPVADELLDAGIPKEDIVLGFQPAEVRQYTDFAVG